MKEMEAGAAAAAGRWSGQAARGVMSELNEMGCAGVADAAAELALGVLPGRERARVLAHLDWCGACRENVRRLTMTGDALMELLPGSEPPLGFETGVMARTGLSRAVPSAGTRAGPAREGHQAGHAAAGRVVARRAFGWRRSLAAAACALAVAGAGLGGWGLHPAARPSGSLLRSAALLSPARHAVGQVFAYAGGSGFVYMWVDTGSGDGIVTCQVTGRDGRVITVGRFWLAGGHGAWGSPDGADSSWLSGARLVAADGTVVATATFAG
jgi:hypothetical protein